MKLSKALRNCWKRVVTVSVAKKVLLVQKRREVVAYHQDAGTLQALKESDSGAICKTRDEPPSLGYSSIIFWMDCDKL